MINGVFSCNKTRILIETRSYLKIIKGELNPYLYSNVWNLGKEKVD